MSNKYTLLDPRDSEIYSPEASDGEPGLLRRIWLRLFGGKDRRLPRRKPILEEPEMEDNFNDLTGMFPDAEKSAARSFTADLREQAKWIDEANASNRLMVPDNQAIGLEDVDTDELRGAADEIERLEKELGRAYRALRGFWTAREKGELLDKTAMAYHSPTIGAACRFVGERSLDGAKYFIGKPVDVLHNALNPKRVQ